MYNVERYIKEGVLTLVVKGEIHVSDFIKEEEETYKLWESESDIKYLVDVSEVQVIGEVDDVYKANSQNTDLVVEMPNIKCAIYCTDIKVTSFSVLFEGLSQSEKLKSKIFSYKLAAVCWLNE